MQNSVMAAEKKAQIVIKAKCVSIDKSYFSFALFGALVLLANRFLGRFPGILGLVEFDILLYGDGGNLLDLFTTLLTAVFTTTSAHARGSALRKKNKPSFSPKYFAYWLVIIGNDRGNIAHLIHWILEQCFNSLQLYLDSSKFIF